MSCGSCGESRFSNAGQLRCHVAMNHAEYKCGCDKRFMMPSLLSAHIESAPSKPFPCATNDCCKSFGSESARQAHKRDKDHCPNINRDKTCDCGKQFKSREAVINHLQSKNKNHEFIPCLRCTKTFDCSKSLEQHKNSTGHTYNIVEDKQRLAYVKEYCKTVSPDKTNKKEAVKVVRNVVDNIMKNVRNQDGGDIYGNEVRKAGSYATKTKVGKADEFDLNIPLDIPKDKVSAKTSGEVGYKVNIPTEKGNKETNLNIKSNISPSETNSIKKGYATIEINESENERFRHVMHNGYIVPRLLKEDLYNKVKTAISKLGLIGNVDVSRDSHGPAVTITIKNLYDHHISVDLSTTMNPNVPISINQFPRPQTVERLPKKSISAAKNAGTHLVPKGNDQWLISNSKAERALLATIDEGNGCRKNVHRMMKKDAAKWKSASEDGLPGMSSHVLKNQILWMNERKENSDQNYWKQENIDRCYMDALKDFELKCRMGKLPNYFNTSENILAGKNKDTLLYMADCAKERREELAHLRQ